MGGLSTKGRGVKEGCAKEVKEEIARSERERADSEPRKEHSENDNR